MRSQINIRLHSKEELELINSAALRRGMSTNLFVRTIALGVARRVLQEPPDDLVGRYIDGLGVEAEMGP